MIPTEAKFLDVTQLEPRMKHPMIFQLFDELSAGESLEIHNDHDPKPLYYQLLAERGPKIGWEYIEFGPPSWRVRITKQDLDELDQSIGSIVAADLRKARVFKKMGLDFCCGGNKSVKQACADKGIAEEKVRDALKQIDLEQYTSRQQAYDKWELDFLADYIVSQHHKYIEDLEKDLRFYVHKVTKVHGAEHPELARIHELTDKLLNELIHHMEKEETIVFPYVKYLLKSLKKGGTTALGQEENMRIAQPIKVMEMEHEEAGETLVEIRKLTSDYELPQGACASYSMLYRMLEELEEDLHLHIHLENNILFPKAMILEKELFSRHLL
jgi:regulator of cell morphogenesis and NO signaling